MIPASNPLLMWLCHWLIRRRGSCRVAILALAALGGACGCKSTVDDVNIKDVYGPAGRRATNLVEQAKRDVKGDPELGQAEFDAAHKLYEEQNYVAARKALRKIQKKYKKKDPPILEDVMFYMAESDFQLGHYPAAQDGYDELLKKYGNTKYFDQTIRRLFAIGRYWLKSPKPASEIELASFKDENGSERLDQLQEAYDPGEFFLKPNFSDRSRPFLDTAGRAKQALRAVHLHDPSGKLADESLMILAIYHFRKRDYREADTYFAQIRESYPKSKYLPDAYILGAHASYKSYQGACYDGKQLEEARKLTKSATRLFPDLPQRPKLENDLQKIDAEEVEREWQRVLFYKKRKEKDAAAVYCEFIAEKYPDSPQAAKARELLKEYGPQHAQGILTTPLFDAKKPSASDKPASSTNGTDKPASKPGKTGPEKSGPDENEPAYDDPEEPAKLRVSDSDKEAKPISESK